MPAMPAPQMTMLGDDVDTTLSRQRVQQVRIVGYRRPANCDSVSPGEEMPLHRIDRRTLSLLGLSALLAPPRALAQDAYPSRPIRLVVGFTAGAASDFIGRTFANAAGPILGQQFVVENKPG